MTKASVDESFHHLQESLKSVRVCSKTCAIDGPPSKRRKTGGPSGRSQSDPECQDDYLALARADLNIVSFRAIKNMKPTAHAPSSPTRALRRLISPYLPIYWKG